MSEKYLPFTEEERKRRVEDQRLGSVGIDDPARWDATLRALEGEIVTVRTEKHTALRERDHWLDRLIVEQEKHTETDAARIKWLFKAAELERERDAYRRVVGVYQDKWPTPREKAADIRWWTKVLEFDPAHKEKEARAWEMLADVVEEAVTP